MPRGNRVPGRFVKLGDLKGDRGTASGQLGLSLDVAYGRQRWAYSKGGHFQQPWACSLNSGPLTDRDGGG